MEPKPREDHAAPDRKTTEQSTSNPSQATFTTPFASEGLERVRDSHC